MPPKRKKAVKNSYSFFLDDYQEAERQKGRHISKVIASEECALIWKKMDPKDKKPYEEMARAYNERTKNDLNNKFTTDGKTYAELEEEQRLEAQKTQRMEKEIKNTIASLSPNSSLREKEFYIIHVNYYCRTNQGLYIPAEIALSCFSLQEGLKGVYHTLVDPGCLPIGYTLEGKTNSTNIHDLPLPPYDAGEKDFGKVLKRIMTFLEAGKMPDGQYPPVYAVTQNIKASENVLRTMTDSLYPEEMSIFRVYPLDKMYFHLRNKCSQSYANPYEGFPVSSIAKSEIDKDVFCYTRGISCLFHMNSEEKEHNCSQGIVTRYVFQICDMCCADLGIPLVEGKHCPVGTDLKRNSRATTALPSAALSRASSRTASEFGEYSDDESQTACNSSVFSMPRGSQLNQTQGFPAARYDKQTPSRMWQKEPSAMKPLKLPKTKPKTLSQMRTTTSSVPSLPFDFDDDFPPLGGLNISKK